MTPGDERPARARMRRDLGRRVLERLPAAGQLPVERAVLRLRRRVLAARSGTGPRPPLVDLPGGGRPLLLTALGGDADAESIAATAAQRDPGRAVLLVTDRDAFDAFRRAAVAFEYVPPAVDHERLADPKQPYTAFLADRLAAIRAAYRTAGTEAVPGTETVDSAEAVPGTAPLATDEAVPGTDPAADDQPTAGNQPAPGSDARGRILVASTVHVADDPRIHRRTVGVLARHTPVRYATRPPAPADTDGHDWVPLHGGRVRRALGAARQAWRRDVAVVSLHDPELLPLGLAVRWLRRVPVVFDLHEDVPGQLATKPWLPRPLRRPLARVAAWLLRLAERHLSITLAEPNYARLFARTHPVLPNYPEAGAFAEPQPDGGEVVYVGSVTEARGAVLAVRAVAELDDPPPLRLIGTCAPQLAARLAAEAARAGVALDLPGFQPHTAAMAAVARATAGLAPLDDIPNYRDSLPTKTLEYLALGVPVIASDLPGTRAVIGDLPGVQLVAPRDVRAWATALQRVRDDPAWRAAAREGGAVVRERFAWPADELWRIYADLLAERQQRQAAGSV